MKSATLLILTSLVFPSICFTQNADPIAVEAAKSLRSPQYKNVRVSIRGNVVTLTGNVAFYAIREDAENQVRRIRGIGTVSNEIQVNTAAIPDRELQTNVEIAITENIYRRIHSVPNLSALISVHVHRGVVILEGNLPNVQLEHDVFVAVAQTKGVREIVDRLQLGSDPELISVWPPNVAAVDVEAK